MSRSHGQFSVGGNLNSWTRDILSGAGSLFDISGSYVGLRCQYHRSDADAIGSDWKAVGQDMTTAFKGFARRSDGQSK